MATQCLTLGAPDTPPEVRKAFAGVTDALLEILDMALRRLHFHSLRANQGAQFADAFQTQISLEGQHSTYLPPDVVDFDRCLAEKVVATHQKAAASQTANSSGWGRGRFRGRSGERGGRGGSSRGRGFGRSRGGGSSASLAD